MYEGIVDGFLDCVRRYPERPALDVGGEVYSYETLARYSGDLTRAIQAASGQPRPLVAFLAYRSLAAYSSVLGVLGAGRGCVPLNPKFPIARLATMIERSGVGVLIVGEECSHLLESLLDGLVAKGVSTLTILLAGVAANSQWASRFPQYRVNEVDSWGTGEPVMSFPAVEPTDYAYVLFTSGTTGEPKGVPITQLNITSYIDYVSRRFRPTPDDRFAQNSDLTFDMSVHDMFLCWWNGGCLCCIPGKSMMAPGKFIREKAPTFWFSVPSVAIVCAKLGMLRPGAFPSLRYSLFAGDALPAEIALKWQAAAPGSVLENMYGPTETTITISHFTWDSENSPAICVNGIVPIGYMFDGQECAVVNERGESVRPGDQGELWLAGSQIAPGYLNDPEKTGEKFVRRPHDKETIWYRSGDLVKEDGQGCLYYLGRIDHQLKISGYRIELLEVDAVIREAARNEAAVTVAWPVVEGRAEGLVSFVAGSGDESRLLESCRAKLPEYMIPQSVYFIDEIPLNPNGKFDRRKLTEMLDGGDLVSASNK